MYPKIYLYKKVRLQAIFVSLSLLDQSIKYEWYFYYYYCYTFGLKYNKKTVKKCNREYYFFLGMEILPYYIWDKRE